MWFKKIVNIVTASAIIWTSAAKYPKIKQEYETAKWLYQASKVLKNTKNVEESLYDLLWKCELSMAEEAVKYVAPSEQKKLLTKIETRKHSKTCFYKNVESWIKWKPNGSLLSKLTYFWTELSPVWDVRDVLKYSFKPKHWWVDNLTLWLSVVWLASTASLLVSAWSSAVVKVASSAWKKLHKLQKVWKIIKIPKWFDGVFLDVAKKFWKELKNANIKPIKFDKFSFENIKEAISRLWENIHNGKVKEIIEKMAKSKEMEKVEKLWKNIFVLEKSWLSIEEIWKILSKTKKAQDLEKIAKLSNKLWAGKFKLFLKAWSDDFIELSAKYGEKLDVKLLDEAYKRKDGFKILNKLWPEKFKKALKLSKSERIIKLFKTLWAMAKDFFWLLVEAVLLWIMALNNVIWFIANRFRKNKLKNKE